MREDLTKRKSHCHLLGFYCKFAAGWHFERIFQTSKLKVSCKIEFYFLANKMNAGDSAFIHTPNKSVWHKVKVFLLNPPPVSLNMVISILLEC